jgi:nucleoid DNA-binding protein
MNLTKQHLVQILIEHHGLNRDIASEVVSLYFSEIKKALTIGKKVKSPGFGSFEIKHTKPRIGRNPKTKEEFPIPSLKKVKFSLSKKAKQLIN